MKRAVQNSCLYIIALLLFALVAAAGGIILAVAIITGLLSGNPSATLLWTGFGLLVGGRVITAILSCVSKTVEKYLDDEIN